MSRRSHCKSSPIVRCSSSKRSSKIFINEGLTSACWFSGSMEKKTRVNKNIICWNRLVKLLNVSPVGHNPALFRIRWHVSIFLHIYCKSSSLTLRVKPSQNRETRVLKFSVSGLCNDIHQFWHEIQSHKEVLVNSVLCGQVSVRIRYFYVRTYLLMQLSREYWQ
jgi:hypothetical protein